jgi:FixJ family two-component response regulator
MSGGELARHLREIRPDLPVLLITGYTGAKADVMNLPRLEKPFGQAELASALARLFSDDNVVALRSPKAG